MLEMGPKGKKVVAVAPDWPGLSRGAKTGEAAIERLLSYVPRSRTATRAVDRLVTFHTKNLPAVFAWLAL